MLVEQIDGVDLEALERALDDVCDVLRPAAELGCDHDLVAHRRQGFAHEFFVFVCGPYASAVSKRGTPRSKADRMREIISCLSAAGP